MLGKRKTLNIRQILKRTHSHLVDTFLRNLLIKCLLFGGKQVVIKHAISNGLRYINCWTSILKNAIFIHQKIPTIVSILNCSFRYLLSPLSLSIYLTLRGYHITPHNKFCCVNSFFFCQLSLWLPFSARVKESFL